jgi:hypothetical protein
MKPRLPAARAQGSAARALFLLLTIPACVSSGGPAQSPLELTVTPVSVDAGVVTSSEPTPKRCTLRLRSGYITKSQPGCIIDSEIGDHLGILSYPCTGDGAIEADFGEQHYVGAIHAGEVQLTFETELEWEDGCRWGTRAAIEGNVATNGASSHSPLSWSYHDVVLRGTNCSGVCTARASFQVTPD